MPQGGGERGHVCSSVGVSVHSDDSAQSLPSILEPLKAGVVFAVWVGRNFIFVCRVLFDHSSFLCDSLASEM